MNNRRTVAVIGAGAAGLMAAGRAAECGADVILFEKNARVGRKLAITGKGRCNVTNFCDNDTFIANLTANPRFMYSAINRFSCYDTVAFFEERGVPVKVERGNRVFPESDKAADIVEALHDYAMEHSVRLCHENVRDIITENGSVVSVKTESGEYPCDCVIVATGGMSYKATGSTGDGYTFARRLGHTVTAILPSLVPLVSDDEACRVLSGLSLRNVTLKIIDNNSDKEIYSELGELLFTHFGLSGPLVLSASAHMRAMSVGRYTALIDLKPALDTDTLDKRVLRDLKKYANKDIINALSELLPKSMIPVTLDRAGIDPHTKCNELSAESRHRFVDTLKNLSFSIHSFRPINEAIVTHGGVNVNEINPKTMESKLVHGLYFAGEVLDLDAYTGGFNLQIAFSTGRLAGESAADTNR